MSQKALSKRDQNKFAPAFVKLRTTIGKRWPTNGDVVTAFRSVDPRITEKGIDERLVKMAATPNLAVIACCAMLVRMPNQLQSQFKRCLHKHAKQLLDLTCDDLRE